MPLIILTGYPSSGKSRRADQLKRLLEAKITALANGTEPAPAPVIQKKTNIQQHVHIPKVVHVVNTEQLGFPRSVYASAHEEKKARAALFSTAERLLTRDSFVILDAMNYIKGFRYQLYCGAKLMNTTHCIIHCAVSTDTAKEWNKSRDESERYSDQVIEELLMRYEEPDGRNRWDSPLFTIVESDDEPPFDAIWDALVNKVALTPNKATTVTVVSDANYVAEFEATTQAVVNAVMAAVREGTYVAGDLVAMPKTKTRFTMPYKTCTIAELKRHRMQFANLNKMHRINDMDRVATLFVEYLNTNYAANA